MSRTINAAGLAMVKVDYRITSMDGGVCFILTSYVDLVFLCRIIVIGNGP